MLLDSVEEYFAFFGEHKHSTLRERHLLNFRAPRQIADGVKIFTVAISDAFDFDGAEFGLRTDMERSLLINIRFMIPPECNIDDIGFLVAFELLDLLWREVAVVLRWIDLETFAPDINIGLYRF
tara:strand:+ start:212 stop:583 length:372 start_codon:yes stop_codon:yes gene_type:complete